MAVGNSDSASFLDDDDDDMTDDEDLGEETEVRISFLSTGEICLRGSVIPEKETALTGGCEHAFAAITTMLRTRGKLVDLCVSTA